MLVMWLDLQRAVKTFARVNHIPHTSVVPWECHDETTAGLWKQLTHPNNLAELENWLEAEQANDNSNPWTKEAVKQCRDRASHEGRS